MPRKEEDPDETGTRAGSVRHSVEQRRSSSTPQPAEKQAPSTTLDDLFGAHLRGERAIAAARRFISRYTEPRLTRSAVADFLRRRRDPLSPGDIDRCADEAIKRWMSSRANRYRGPR
jgi:hypothetical protein